jgi:hypothetical protein
MYESQLNSSYTGHFPVVIEESALEKGLSLSIFC